MWTLLGRGDVHDDTALEHLGEVLVEFVTGSLHELFSLVPSVRLCELTCRAVRGTVSRDTTTVLRRMFHVLMLNGECARRLDRVVVVFSVFGCFVHMLISRT